MKRIPGFLQKNPSAHSRFTVILPAAILLLVPVLYSCGTWCMTNCDQICEIQIRIIDDGSNGTACGYLTTATFEDASRQYHRDNGPNNSTSSDRTVAISPCIPSSDFDSETYRREFTDNSEIVVQACYPDINCPGPKMGILIESTLTGQQLFDRYGVDEDNCRVVFTHDLRNGFQRSGCFECCTP